MLNRRDFLKRSIQLSILTGLAWGTVSLIKRNGLEEECSENGICRECGKFKDCKDKRKYQDTGHKTQDKRL